MNKEKVLCQFILTLLTKLGLGINGIIPFCVDNFAAKISEFATIFSAVVESYDEAKLVLKITNQNDKEKYFYIVYGFESESKRIISIDVVTELKETNSERIILDD